MPDGVRKAQYSTATPPPSTLPLSAQHGDESCSQLAPNVKTMQAAAATTTTTTYDVQQQQQQRVYRAGASLTCRHVTKIKRLLCCNYTNALRQRCVYATSERNSATFDLKGAQNKFICVSD